MVTIFNNLLKRIFTFTGDWGLAIVLLTIAVKVILLPISIKQKISLTRQQEISKKMEDIKVKYKNDKEKLDKELKKHYEESAKSMLGCFVSLLQLPIISSLYLTIIRLPVEVSTILIPWVTNIKLPDKYFILPIIYLIANLCPSLISYIPYFRVGDNIKVEKPNILMTAIISILFVGKAPVGVGIYLITSSIFSFMEELVYRFYIRRKCLN